MSFERDTAFETSCLECIRESVERLLSREAIDRADIAVLAGATGVHVGQDDLTPAEVRVLLGDDAVVGLSTHTAEQMDRALTEPITYLAIGPIFSTMTKA